jgi:hypothetical protein
MRNRVTRTAGVKLFDFVQLAGRLPPFAVMLTTALRMQDRAEPAPVCVIIAIAERLQMADITRNLTAGEKEMLRAVFGTGITYSSVRIHNYKWFIFQPDDTAMTPNGQMYWPPAEYLADFSLSTVGLSTRAWFVHEGTHLYQHYGLGWNVIARGIVDREYNYTLDPAKKFADYGLEQMGDIASDYYTLKQSGRITKSYGLADYASLLPIP